MTDAPADPWDAALQPVDANSEEPPSPGAPALSVLDLVPVRTGQTTGQALAASTQLARTADAAGFTRYWVAEHHNTSGVASTTPAVIIALLAGATQRIRLGSGGVMLPNHAPLAVAEQFALLEAAHPGRIDLGIGRAPGTDGVTSWALRHGASDAEVVEAFPEYVQQVMAFMAPQGATARISGRDFPITATPHAIGSPPVWLLGSSDYSARLAAQLGLPYVFAHHFAGRGTAEALALYRDTFTSVDGSQPQTFLTVNVVVAPTQQEAEEWARPYQHMMAAIRSGQARRPVLTVEEAAATEPIVPADQFAALAQPWVVGTPAAAAERIRALAEEFAVDEVMVHPVGGAHDADPLDRTPAREYAITALAAEVGLTGPAVHA